MIIGHRVRQVSRTTSYQIQLPLQPRPLVYWPWSQEWKIWQDRQVHWWNCWQWQTKQYPWNYKRKNKITSDAIFSLFSDLEQTIFDSEIARIKRQWQPLPTRETRLMPQWLPCPVLISANRVRYPVREVYTMEAVMAIRDWSVISGFSHLKYHI